MCGIIGYTGRKSTLPSLTAGLRALEYRGYDSAGVAVGMGGKLRQIKAAGRLASLEAKLAEHPELLGATCGIGHTRWATHGEPSELNCHPHGTERVMLVHNGIIENHAELRRELESRGETFTSSTDTEAAARLLDRLLDELPPRDALARLRERLEGSYAFAIIFASEPEKIYALRKGSPLTVGLASDGNSVASDLTALLAQPDAAVRDHVRLEEDELAVVEPDRVTLYRADREPTVLTLAEGSPRILRTDLTPETAEKGDFAHFMLKEINEEPDVIRRTLSLHVRDGLPYFEDSLAEVTRLRIIACGTAMHAGLIAKAMFNRLAKLPVEVEPASEFRSADPLLSPGEAVMAISQSGETADTLAATRLASSLGARIISVVNVLGSTLALESDSVIYTLAGPEIAVASTKAYSVQTALLTLMAADCGLKRGVLTEAEARELTAQLTSRVPEAIAEVIRRSEELAPFSEAISGSDDCFYIGRGIDSSLAAEGSLKLKEISYIHSEALAAGELKHGTISLIEPGVPVLALMTERELSEKSASNLREVKSRGAVTLAIGVAPSEGADREFLLPETDGRLAFLPAATAMQIIAYRTAVARGCDVDKPRNLAKSVTVE